MMTAIRATLALLLASAGAACATPAPPAAEDVTAIATMADAAVQDYQLRDLAAHVQQMPDGPVRDYFNGMLAARSGRFRDAIAQLHRALPHLRNPSPKRAATALEALATAYRAENQYSDATQAYAELSDNRFSTQLDRFPADDAALARILSATPPQTIAWEGPVALKTSVNPIGSRVAELVANGVLAPWLLDTGANQSVVSRSFAARLGVVPLQGEATVGSGVTGRESPMRVAVLPTMRVGGATLTNVVLLVVDDENLRIGISPEAYQIDAILGYPVLKALEVVTFTRDAFLAGDAADRSGPRGRMYMRGLTPAIECEVDGRPLLFTFDTGATTTDLSVRYYELFRDRADSWKKRSVETAGAGGSVKHEVYIQPQLVMRIGGSPIALRNVSILPSRMNAEIDVLFGNLGQDFVEGFESYSLDFRAMTFSLGPPHGAR